MPNVRVGLNVPVTPPVAVRIVYLSPTTTLLPRATVTLAPLRVPTVPGRPGIRVPPALTVIAGTEPVPSSVPPELIVTPLEKGIAPVTDRVPPSTVVAPAD